MYMRGFGVPEDGANETMVLDNGLVRIRGMVQDTLDRVIMQSTRAADDANDSTEHFLTDRYFNVDRYTIVSIPGLTLGTGFDLAALQEAQCDGENEKRRLALESETEPKRVRESTVSSEEPPAMIPANEQLNERISPSDEPHPIPSLLVPQEEKGVSRFSFIAHLADCETDFKVHDIVDIVGIPSHTSADYMENPGTVPAVNFVMEVIKMEKVADPPSPAAMCKQDIHTARAKLKILLTSLCKGDSLAAEYLLLQVVSARVPGNEMLPTMGSWSLNISNSDSIDLDPLRLFLKSISPAAVQIACNNANLSRHRFYMERQADNEYTSPAILQLSANTTVLLDERALDEGNVNALNVLAINKAVRDQELVGIFGNSQLLYFPLNLKFLIFSRGISLFSPSNPAQGIMGTVPIAHLKLNGDSTNNLTSEISPEDLLFIQQYVAYSRSLIANMTISEEVVKQFENDWVESRRKEPISTDDIHLWATLLKSMPASWGSTQTTLSEWSQVMEIESQRRARVPQSAPYVQSAEPELVAVNGA